MPDTNEKKPLINPFLKGLDRGSINAWVTENIKTIKDAFNFQKKLSTTTFPTTTTEVSPISSALQQWTKETAQKIGTFIAKSTMPQEAEAATKKVNFTPLTEEARKAVEKEFMAIEQEKQIKALFNNLSNKGYFRNPKQSFEVLKPILGVITSKGEIPSWHTIADWQINFVDKMVNNDEIAKNLSDQYREMGYYYDPNVFLNIIYAKNFDKLYRMIEKGDLKLGDKIVDVPTRLLSDIYIKDPHANTITKSWITRVYAGYKLMKVEPPEPIKFLYHTISKGTSSTAILEEGIYDIGQDIHRATGESTEIPVVETTSEPEVYTIQTKFLRK
jgi:hypothetical protein